MKERSRQYLQFRYNLGECIKWTAYVMGLISAVVVLFVLLLLIGGSPSLRVPIAEEFPYFLIGVQRVFLYAVLPLLACAVFKTLIGPGGS